MPQSSEWAKERKSNPEPLTLRIFTRAPSKWRLVDLERRQVYRVVDGQWSLDDAATARMQPVRTDETDVAPSGEA